MTALGLVLYLYVIIEGIAFHRSISTANSLLIDSSPPVFRAIVDRPVEIQSFISNPSRRNFRVQELMYDTDIDSIEQARSEPFLLVKFGRQVVRTRLKCQTSGRFEFKSIRVSLSSRLNIFKHSIFITTRKTLICRPTIEPLRLASIDSSYLAELTSDKIRRGPGLDLAGIRPSTLMEDLHSIDWKATARSGKLMVRESYLERQPSIIIAVDSSKTMKIQGKGGSMFSQMLASFSTLITSIKPATPIGLVIYDENSVIANLPVEVGEFQRQKILSVILDRSMDVPHNAEGTPSPGENSPSQATRIGALVGGRKPAGIPNSFARLRWLNRNLLHRKRRELQAHGAYKAFTQICDFDSGLVIAITDGKTNLTALLEGARIATASGHRVVLVLLRGHRRIATTYILSRFEDIDARLQECMPQEISMVLENEIMRMTGRRIALAH